MFSKIRKKWASMGLKRPLFSKTSGDFRDAFILT